MSFKPANKLKVFDRNKKTLDEEGQFKKEMKFTHMPVDFHCIGKTSNGTTWGVNDTSTFLGINYI